MQNTYKWEITPTSWPVVIRNCPKCGSSSEYECSGNFRVNANQNTIDVWLIYQCNKCNNTWNMEILSRTNVKSVNKDLYLKFLANDKELAKFYAFDISALRRNKVNISYEYIEYDIKGDALEYDALTTACQIDIICDLPFELRLDRLLVKQLGLSREKIRKLGDAGKITSTEGRSLTKIKLINNLRVFINP